MGLWKGLGGLFSRLKPEPVFTALPRPPPSAPNPSTLSPGAIKKALRKKLYAVPRTRKQHQIFTDVSRHEAGTTFAGVWNPHPGGTVQDAFKLTINHTSIPLKLGDSTLYLPPANITLSEAYAVYIAISLWKHRLQGGEVKCIGDNSTAIAVLSGKGSGFTKITTKMDDGKIYQRQVLQAISAATADIALKNNIILDYTLVRRSENKLPHYLSRSWAKDDMAKVDRAMMMQVKGSEKRLRKLDNVGLGGSSFVSRLLREFADLGEEIRRWARNST